MPNNDDLFAGMTVAGREVPTIEKQAVISAGIPEDDADLFTGFTVGASAIPAPAKPVEVVTATPPQPTPELVGTPQPITQGLEIIEPRPAKIEEVNRVGPGMFETAGEFLSSIDLGAVGDLFTGKSRQTEISKSLPEIGDVTTGDIDADFKLASGLLASFDEQDQIDIIKNTVPDTKFFRDEKQNVIVEYPNGETAVLNQPGLSFSDAERLTANVLAFIPTARLASLGKSIAQKVGIGATGSGTTQAGIETATQALGAEREFDVGGVAAAAALGGAAELAVPAAQAIRQARQAKRVGVESAQLEAAAKAAAPAQESISGLRQATGQEVGLFPAQQTLIPSEVLKQRLLPQLDAGARTAAKALETQNKEAFDATAELLNTIAGPEVAGTGAARFRTAAQKAIQAGKDRRSQETRVLFKDALDTDADVELSGVRSLIDDNLDGAPEGGEVFKAMTRIKNFIKPKEVDSIVDGEVVGVTKTEPTLRQLQKAKFEIDNMIEKFGENSLSNTTKRDVLEVKRSLVGQMEEASPLFKQANERFAELSPAVKELQDSIVGSISKVKDTDLQNISRRIFSPNSNPAVIRNAKAIIDKADPGAWNDMLRTELQRRFGGIETLAEDLPGELVGNVPGQLRRAIFGNPEQRRTLLSAMNPDQKKNFVYLDDVLRRASSGRAAGSPTTPFKEALDRLKGVSGVIRDTILRPVQTLQETGERGLFDRNVAALTEIMFNPKFKKELTELRSFNPDSPAAARALTQLLNSAEEKEE